MRSGSGDCGLIDMQRQPRWRRPGIVSLSIYLALFTWSLICLFPIYWLAVTSLKETGIVEGPPRYLPFVDFQPTLEAWRFILADQRETLLPRILNSLVIGCAATAIALLAAVLALYSLTRQAVALRWPSVAVLCVAALLALSSMQFQALGMRMISVLATLVLGWTAFVVRNIGAAISAGGGVAAILATRILPPAVVVMPIYLMTQALHALDSRLVMIFLYAAVNLPVAIWLLQPVLGHKPTDQEEAARIDGASHFTILFSILLPMVRAGLVACMLIVFLLCWNEYLFAAFLTSDSALTLPPWIMSQISFKEAQVGGGAEDVTHLSAAALFIALPPLLLAGFTQHVLMRSAMFRPLV